MHFRFFKIIIGHKKYLNKKPQITCKNLYFMKNLVTVLKIFIFLLIYSQFSTAKAQDPLGQVNNELRTFFSPLTPPPPPSGTSNFLYDMAAHIADSVFFNSNCTEVNNTNNWYLLYSEMRNMSYDTTSFITDDSLYTLAEQSVSNDTIPMGLMLYNFYILTPTALNSNTYFNFDTVNNTISDKIGRPSSPCGFGPYCQDTIFSGSPLFEESDYGHVIFKFSPEFFLHDQNIDYNNLNLYVDFGDGSGNHIIDLYNTTTVTVDYRDAGEYKIIYSAFNGSAYFYSQSSFTVKSNKVYVAPDYNVSIEGLHVGVYEGCNPDGIRRAVIYLEGFDPNDFRNKAKNSRDVAEIYDDVIKSYDVDGLLRYGYDFYVVNWKNSRVDIRDNADYVIELIRYLKDNYDNNEQFVIMGESMGGLVARYALTKMENSGENHRTRLMITIDTPHGGANLPLSLQHLYRDVFSLVRNSIPFVKYVPISSRRIGEMMNIYLDSKAARQMLIYHINEQHCQLAQYSCYEADNAKDEFFNDLASIGNYPKHCKLIATSNGSMFGAKQTRAYNDQDRVGGDKLLDFQAEVYVRILGIRINLIGANFELNTNPNGKGQISNIGAGFNTVKIRLRWFSVRITTGYTSWFNIQRFGDVKDFCVNAGGVENIKRQPKIAGFNNDWDIGLGEFKVASSSSNNNGNGLYEFKFRVGVPWFANTNANLSIYSDGFHFGFIPVQSAIDYDGFPNNPLDLDIANQSVGDIMNRTPFDVILGNTNIQNVETETIDGRPYYQYYYNNFRHVSLRNDNLGTLRTCSNPKLLINTEIGDEELWLNNMDLNRDAIYPSAFTINIGQNKYYEHPSAINNCGSQSQAFSKEENFRVTTGTVALIYDQTIQFTQSIVGNYTDSRENFNPCCNLVLPRKTFNKSFENQKINEMLIFPNPIYSDQTFTIKSELLNGNGSLQIIDNMGKNIYTQTFTNNTNEIVVNNLPPNLSSGIYHLIITTNSSRFNQSFQIN